jgi:[ribosomal protein S5]-alanine N-acetyltransferase
MTELRIKVRDGIYLSAPCPADKPALLEHLHSKDVYRNTLTIPHPYLDTDADSWIRKRTEQTERVGKELVFAVRDVEGKLVGVVGADITEPGLTEEAEIGYWLAKPYWGQDIMTDAVRAYVEYAFGELKLLRLTAHVFEANMASARVLEKNGFKLEGYQRKHFQKDGEWLDSLSYALLKEDLSIKHRAP